MDGILTNLSPELVEAIGKQCRTKDAKSLRLANRFLGDALASVVLRRIVITLKLGSGKEEDDGFSFVRTLADDEDARRLEALTHDLELSIMMTGYLSAIPEGYSEGGAKEVWHRALARFQNLTGLRIACLSPSMKVIGSTAWFLDIGPTLESAIPGLRGLELTGLPLNHTLSFLKRVVSVERLAVGLDLPRDDENIAQDVVSRAVPGIASVVRRSAAAITSLSVTTHYDIPFKDDILDSILSLDPTRVNDMTSLPRLTSLTLSSYQVKSFTTSLPIIPQLSSLQSIELASQGITFPKTEDKDDHGVNLWNALANTRIRLKSIFASLSRELLEYLESYQDGLEVFKIETPSMITELMDFGGEGKNAFDGLLVDTLRCVSRSHGSRLEELHLLAKGGWGWAINRVSAISDYRWPNLHRFVVEPLAASILGTTHCDALKSVHLGSLKHSAFPRLKEFIVRPDMVSATRVYHDADPSPPESGEVVRKRDIEEACQSVKTIVFSREDVGSREGAQPGLPVLKFGDLPPGVGYSLVPRLTDKGWAYVDIDDPTLSTASSSSS